MLVSKLQMPAWWYGNIEYVIAAYGPSSGKPAGSADIHITERYENSPKNQHGSPKTGLYKDYRPFFETLEPS